MTRAILLVSILVGLIGSRYANAGNDGGGGAGIMINGRLYSLAEAGLRLDRDKDQPYSPLKEPAILHATIQLIGQIDSILPKIYQGKLSALVFGKYHIYEKLAVMNTVLFQDMKKAYQQYVDMTPKHGAFALGAYTRRITDMPETSVTYLFPDFFSPKTPPETQALYLVTHEAMFFLNDRLSLKDVLAFEVATVDFLKDPSSIDKRQAVFDALQNTSFFDAAMTGDFDVNKGSDLNIDMSKEFYFKTLEERGLSLLLLADLIGNNLPTQNTGEYNTDIIALSSVASKDPQLVTRLYQAKFAMKLPGGEHCQNQITPKDIALQYFDGGGTPYITLLVINCINSDGQGTSTGWLKFNRE